MSEQKETTTPPAPRKQRDKQPSGSSGAFLAMVIALAAGGGSYYLWQQNLIAAKDRQALQASVTQLLAVIEEKDAAQLARIEQLRQHRHGPLEQRLQALEHSLPDLSQQLTLQQRDWQLAEVDHLLRLAQQRLELMRDIPTAITALQQAAEQLQRYTGGDYSDVVTAIGTTIDQLAAIDHQATARVISRLGELITRLDALTFVQQPAQETTLQPEPTTPPTTTARSLGERLKQWGQMAWRDIKSLVTIRRNDEISHPQLNLQRRSLLLEQLRLNLETARLAALSQDQALFRSSLNEAILLLQRNFDQANPQVSETHAALNELAGSTIAPELPSLESLRQQLHSQHSQRQSPQPAADAPATSGTEQEPLALPPGDNSGGGTGQAL